MITNPTVSSTTESFTLTSYTSSAFTYKIDEITGGLIPSFACSLPCKSCTSSDPTFCLSCFTDVSSILEMFLHATKCLTECPDGYYADEYSICKKCDDRCLTCTNATACVTCDTATTATYPFYHSVDSWCYTTCPDGYFGNSTY